MESQENHFLCDITADNFRQSLAQGGADQERKARAPNDADVGAN
jgi:hypothetical protein